MPTSPDPGVARHDRSGRPVPAHMLRVNHTTRLPRRHVFLDTETTAAMVDGVQVQSWACAVAETYDCDTRRKAPALIRGEYTDPLALWEDIAAFTRPGARTLLWAHNLSFDLRVSRAFVILPLLGWQLAGVSMDALTVWARFTRDRATLQMCDSMSWLPCGLGDVASDLGAEQHPLTLGERDTRILLDRCAQDVTILRDAVIHLLDWVAADDLGNFQSSGPGQSWSCFRHRHMTHSMLVHDSVPALEAERLAVWPGRTECWRHGIIEEPGLVELDLPRAYATIARDCDIPVRLLGDLPHVRARDYPGMLDGRALLSRVRVSTDIPLVPVQTADGVMWPVGEFSTTLWDPEVMMLIDAGASVRVGKTFVYQSLPALRDWATWILGELDRPDGDLHPLRRRVLKHWSRALIGRFSLRYRSWEVFGDALSDAVEVSTMIDPDLGTVTDMLQVGRQIMELGGMREAENSMPQVTGYITSVCRRRLWDICMAAGAGNVIYMDTDSVIVTAAGAENIAANAPDQGGWGLRAKNHYRRLEVNGPRNLVVDGRVKAAGIPRKGKRKTLDTVTGETWEGLGQALRTGGHTVVRVTERDFTLTASDKRRVWQPDGSTIPVRLSV